MTKARKEMLIAQFQEKFKTKMEEWELQYNDITLYQQAFSHSSFINDFNMARTEHNERLEFLGDAVLELTISRYLFDTFPQLPEGDLTKMRATIVCEPSLVIFAKQIELMSLILLGKGEEKTGGRTRPSLVADVFEAFIGALYLDQGLSVVWQFAETVIFPHVKDKQLTGVIDFKTKFQEFVHQHYLGIIQYRIVKEDGPAHNKMFTSEILLNGKSVSQGEGRTKKESEQKAAEQAYVLMTHKE
ncbi:ribonuclease III [Staphylococcus lutrae]|uniref:Ribonuclease 3 n=1 Tax=Staphylococcus lutrae TaxID=155085 RepID=A0AAC9WJS0_9STAP|nr:ribonuclease III [Staphylococcus lutrae]ARJ51674.1 ribonuclease III [Staphylococcus lutrae]PNZ39056.1 ribonuclease III [Staphylococcus lutrae]